MIDAHSKTPAKENGVGVFSHVLFWVDMRPHSPLDAFVHVPKSRGLARFSQPLVVSPVSWSQDVENPDGFSHFVRSGNDGDGSDAAINLARNVTKTQTASVIF